MITITQVGTDLMNFAATRDVTIAAGVPAGHRLLSAIYSDELSFHEITDSYSNTYPTNGASWLSIRHTSFHIAVTLILSDVLASEIPAGGKVTMRAFTDDTFATPNGNGKGRVVCFDVADAGYGVPDTATNPANETVGQNTQTPSAPLTTTTDHRAAVAAFYASSGDAETPSAGYSELYYLHEGSGRYIVVGDMDAGVAGSQSPGCTLDAWTGGDRIYAVAMGIPASAVLPAAPRGDGIAAPFMLLLGQRRA